MLVFTAFLAVGHLRSFNVRSTAEDCSY